MKLITEEELKYFTYKYKTATNFEKMFLLQERLLNVYGRPVVQTAVLILRRHSYL